MIFLFIKLSAPFLDLISMILPIAWPYCPSSSLTFILIFFWAIVSFGFTHFSDDFFLLKKKILFIYFLERGKGKEERERNISVWLPLMCPQLGTWPATQACALTGNQTGDPLVFQACAQFTELHQLGLDDFFFTSLPLSLPQTPLHSPALLLPKYMCFLWGCVPSSGIYSVTSISMPFTTTC